LAASRSVSGVQECQKNAGSGRAAQPEEVPAAAVD
jgi:hypothetical protein